MEPVCCFDAREYTGVPDTRPCPRALDVPEVIKELDALYENGRDSQAERFLEAQREKASLAGDWRGELSMLSELMGQYCRSKNKEKGLKSVEDGLRLIREHNLGQTLSGATVMLNAATTMKCFGQTEASIPVFSHVCRVYAQNLDPMDYRFAGLYNNMALSCAWMKTSMRMGMDHSDQTIADLMTDGCNMGVKSLNKYLNQYEAADEVSKDIAKRLINLEEQLTKDIRKFL